MASPVIADQFHRMKYMERHGSGLRKIVRETEKPPGYTAAYNPKIFSTATDFRVILKNVNYQLSQKNLVNDQVSEQDKSPDIPHTVLNLCIHLIAHGSEGAQITHAHSIMGTANDKSYDATHDTTHDNLEDDTHQDIHQVSHQDSTPSAVILRLTPHFQFVKSESSRGEANISFSPHSVKSLYFVSVYPMQKQQKPDIHLPPDAYAKTHNYVSAGSNPAYLYYAL